VNNSEIKIDKLINFSLTQLILIQIINSLLTEELNWLSNPAYLGVQGARVQRALIGVGPADYQWVHAILIPIPLQLFQSRTTKLSSF